MNDSRRGGDRNIIFVSPRLVGESLQGARAVARLNSVRLLGICEQLTHPIDAGVFSDVVRVDDPHDSSQLIVAANRLALQYGELDRIVTVHESLLAPVAEASESLGLPGLRLAAVRRTLDKSLLKKVLQEGGIKTAGDRIITEHSEAVEFVEEVGFPVVFKPLRGSGGLATWRVSDSQQLAQAIDLLQPTPGNPIFAEDHLRGQELCIDTITVANEPRFFSICRYRPNILEALEDSRIQWTCVMPRDISGDMYREFIAQGLAAVRALKVGDAMTHMEGFLLDNGGISFTDATLRPAGARIAPMLAFAYDIDPYRAWARVAVDGCYDGPWERNHAVGTIFLRGAGQGRVLRIDGMQDVLERLSGMVVDTRLPRVGNPKSVTYTGDGYITIRHPETIRVEEALEMMAQTVVVTYDHVSLNPVPEGIHECRSQRPLHFDQQICRPVWDNDECSRKNV